MSENNFYRTRKTRRNDSLDVLRFHAVIGGSKSQLTNILRDDPKALVLAIDNLREIQILREEFGDKSIFYFAMGAGETSGTLHQSSSPSVRAASEKTANMNTFGGYGGRLMNAKTAALSLIQSADFQQFLRQLPEQALERTNCMPSMVTIDLHGSIAGAAFAGSAVVLAKEFVRSLSNLETSIQLRFNILGPGTFVGVTSRCRINAASSLLSTLHYALRYEEVFERKTCKSIFLHEILPTGQNRDRRDEYLLLDGVYTQSIQMTDYLALPQPNREQDDQFGAILSREVDFKNPLNRRLDIAAPIAKVYRNLIQTMRLGIVPDMSTVEEVIFDVVSIDPNRREEVQSIAERVPFDDPVSLVNAINKQCAVTRFAMRYQSQVTTDFVPEDVRLTLAEYPKTFDELTKRLELFAGFEKLASSTLASVEQDLNDTFNQSENLEQNFLDKVTKLQWWRSTSVSKGVFDLMVKIRDVADSIAELEAKQQAVLRGLTSVKGEIEYFHGILVGVEKTLEAYITKDQMQQESNAVVCDHIDHHFAGLLKIASMSEKEQLLVLGSAAAHCSEYGLAKIAGAPSNRLEVIADLIVNGAYQSVGPAHGAYMRQEKADVVYALPPLPRESEERLKDLIESLDPGSTVVFADTNAHGACVARIRFRRFHSVQSLFDGLTGHDLWLAYTDERNALNTIDEWNSLKDFGGRIEGERIVFDKVKE
ncbi:MAG: hypothetical protein SGI77_02910 [Pirellulaceae bacterium]|nr:hypothetical protein [Pirellulaceae bacterium]